MAYVSATSSGVSVIEVLQGRVTKLLSVLGDPHSILLSLDGRLLYVTQPELGLVSVILAETGRPVCTAHLPGEPAFLALDQYSNILYAARSRAPRVTALDPITCSIRHVFEIESPVYGLAAAVIATGSSVNHQLWVAGRGALTIFDGLTERKIGTILVPDERYHLLAIFSPIFPGSPLLKEPERVMHTDAPPLSVAITNDGLSHLLRCA